MAITTVIIVTMVIAGMVAKLIHYLMFYGIVRLFAKNNSK